MKKVLAVVFVLALTSMLLMGLPPAAQNSAEASEPVPMSWEQNGPYSTMASACFLISDTFAISPVNSDVLYYNHRSDFYRSVDGGSNWELMHRDYDKQVADYSLVADVENVNKIYAIQKRYEPLPNPTGSGPLIVSEDGGANWTDLGGSYWNMAQSPLNTDLLYAVGSDNVLMKSIDGGLTWNSTNVTAADAEPPIGYYQRTARVAVDPFDDSCAYVSYHYEFTYPIPDWQYFDYGITVKTDDGGITGEVIYEGRGNWDITIDPGNPDVLYNSSPSGKCLRSEDGGSTWAEIETGYPASISALTTVDYQNSNTIYLYTYKDLFGPFTSEDWTCDLLKSTDGGQTWNEADTGLPFKSFVYEIWADPNQSGVLYCLELVTGRGIYKTVNGGETWFPISDGIHVSNSIVDCDPFGSMVITACGFSVNHSPTGGAFRSYDHAESWTTIVNLGLSCFNLDDIVITPDNPDKIYACSFGTGPLVPGVYISDNGGVNWYAAEPPSGMSWMNDLYGSGVQSLAMAPGDSETLYAAVHATVDGVRVVRIFRTGDGGETWEYKGDAPYNWYGCSYDLIEVDAGDPNTVYIAWTSRHEGYQHSSTVFKSTDGGSSWVETPLGEHTVTCLMTDASTPGLVYAGGRAQDTENPGEFQAYPALYRSEDSGDNWEMIVPDVSYSGYDRPIIRCLCLNPDNSDMLFAAAGQYTQFGDGPATLLSSPDGGDTWEEVDTTDLPDARVLDMACSENCLYLGTNNGLFHSNLYDYSEEFDSSAQEDQVMATESGDTLTVPPGALSEDTEISLSIVTSEDCPEPPGGEAIIARAFDFGPDGTVFQEPVEVVFTYQDSDVPDGYNEEDLTVYYYDSTTSSWALLEGVVDTENTITCSIEHFTTFAITAMDTQAPEVTITTPGDGDDIEGKVDFAAQASDNVKLSKVEFCLDDLLLESDTVEPYIHSLDTDQLNPGVYTLKAVAYDTAGLSSSDSIQVRVKVTQEETNLVLSEPEPVQYSDNVGLSAVLSDGSGMPVPGREIVFSLNDEIQTSSTGEDGVATAVFSSDESQGVYQIDAQFAGDLEYLPSADSTDLQVSCESSVLEYSGDYTVCNDELVELSADITGEADGSPGDIENAGDVVFKVYDVSDNLLAEVITPVSEISPGVGEASVIIDPIPANLYTVKTSLADNGYYQAGEVVSELVSYDPSGGFITGGGFLCEEGFKTFAFCVKPSSADPWLPKGQVRFVDRSDFWHPTKVISDEFTWLVIPEDEDIAYVLGACTYAGEDGYSFFMTVEDLGGWFVNLDTIHIQVLDGDANLVYEVQGVIDGGNIKIHRK